MKKRENMEKFSGGYCLAAGADCADAAGALAFSVAAAGVIVPALREAVSDAGAWDVAGLPAGAPAAGAGAAPPAGGSAATLMAVPGISSFATPLTIT